jgi:hypothetical protein
MREPADRFVAADEDEDVVGVNRGVGLGDGDVAAVWLKQASHSIDSTH